jgi:glycosyltransferase involved in cell wall biosynthesis
MNILLSVPSYFPHSYGGGQTYVRQVANELRSRGHKVSILSSSRWENGNGNYSIEFYEHDGIPIYSVQVNPSVQHLVDAYSQRGLYLIEAIREILRKERPEIIHINGFKPALVQICGDFEIPFVITAHHPGFVCPMGTLLTKNQTICQKPAEPRICVPCCCQQKVSIPILGTMLGYLPNWISRPIGETIGKQIDAPYLARGLAFPWFIGESIKAKRLVLERTPVIIAPSEAMKKCIVLNEVDEKKVVVLPHGIESIGKVPLEPLNGRPVRFGYVGSINSPKGFDVLISAFQRIASKQDCELHVFGEPQYAWEKSYLDQVLNRYSVSSGIFIHGRMSFEDRSKTYGNIDVVVVPSTCMEAFGLVTVEAFSAGRPVIVADSGALPELVRNGVDGFIVERNDSKSLAEAMQKFVKNPDLVGEMSRQILPVKTIQQYVDEVEKIYHRLISSKN